MAVNQTRRIWTFRHMFMSAKNIGRTLFSEKYLLYTNTGIGMGMSAFGDVLQQRYQLSKPGAGKSSLDIKRTGKMAVCGFMAGPIAHYWYIFLDRWLPGRCVRTVVKKVLLDQCVGSPLFISLYLASVAVMDENNWHTIKEDFLNKGALLFLGDCVIWIPAQICNFAILPTRFRVAFDNVVSLLADVFWSYMIFDHKDLIPLSDDT